MYNPYQTIDIVPVIMGRSDGWLAFLGGAAIAFLACPVIPVIQSIIFQRVHRHFGFHPNKDFALPNGIILFDAYCCDEDGNHVENLSGQLVSAKIVAYLCYMLPTLLFVPTVFVFKLDSLVNGWALLIGIASMWIILFSLSIMEQLAHVCSRSGHAKIVGGIIRKVIVMLFCALLMGFPIYSTLNTKDLVCLMRTNCQTKNCMDMSYQSLNISNWEYDNDRQRQTRRLIIQRSTDTGKRLMI